MSTRKSARSQNRSSSSSSQKKIRGRPHPPRGRRRHLHQYFVGLSGQDATTATTMTTTDIPPPLQKLHDLNTLLQRLHVRNKNQHRGQAWYKPFNMLRRSLHALLSLELRMHALRERPVGDAQGVRARYALEEMLGAEKERWERWVRERVVPGCYGAFGAVVRHGQFVGLGVVLMGFLAGVGGWVGLPAVMGVEERGGGVEVLGERDDLGEVVERRVEKREGPEPKPKPELDSASLDEPVGKGMVEGVKQSHGPGRSSNEASEEGDGAQLGTIPTPAVKRRKGREEDIIQDAPKQGKKKSKRKKNAIDDLFAGFD